MRHLICLCTVLLTTSTALADPPPPPVEKVALAPVTGTNVHPAYLDAARDILKEHLMATGRFAVIVLPGESGAVELTPTEAVTQARAAGADIVLITHLARLSGTGRLRMTAYRVATGALSYSDGIGVAGGPDDLDPALKRLAVSFATGKPASLNADIDTVTQKQSDPLIKETATKIFGVRVGLMVPFNRPAGRDTTAVPGIGLFWLYDARSFMGEIALDLHTGENVASFSVGIGGYYPFSKENFTPYIGGSAAYSISNFGGDGANGLRFQPTFGFLFGRVSTVQFRGEIGYFIDSYGERDSSGLVATPGGVPTTTAPGDKHYAHGPQLSVGLGF